MAVTRPSRYPIVAQTPGGNYAEPGSGVQLGGWQTGAIFPSKDANWLLRQITDWGRSLDASRLASTDILDAAKVMRVSSTALTIATGGGTTLTAQITAGGIYYGLGERLDLTDAATVYSGGNSLVFPASSTRYVIARPMPATGGAVSGSSCAELAVSASAAVAGWSTLMTVTTGVATITSALQHVDVVTTFNFGHACVFAEPVDFSSQATFGPTTFNQGSEFNASSTWNVSSALAAVKINQSDAGAALEAVALGGGNALVATGGLLAPAVSLTDGLLAVSTTSATYGASLYGTGPINVTYMLMLAASGTGTGLYCVGSSTGAETAYFDHANNTASTTVFARSASSADTSSRAMKAQGRGSAAGLEAISADYYAAILTPKNSAPTYGAINMTPQTAAPSQAPTGALTCIGGAVAGWAQGNSTDGVYRPLWSSKGGYVYGAQYNQNAQSTGTYATVCTVTLTAPNAPKVAGESVRCRATLRFRCNTAGTPTGVNVRIRDTTAAVNVIEYTGAGFATTNGFYLAAVTVNWENGTVVIEQDYIIPATGSRTFTLDIQRQGAITITGQGSLVIVGV